MRRSRSLRASTLIAIAVLGGCQPAIESAKLLDAAVLHHTLAPEDGLPAGITEGRWAVDGGCLGLDSEAIDYIVLLPAGWTATTGGIVTATGQFAGGVGDNVRLGGGALASPSEAHRLADAPIPTACDVPDYWLVSELGTPFSSYPAPPP